MTDGLSEAYETKQWDVFCENNDLSLENDQLKAENAKLRELLREYHTFLALADLAQPIGYVITAKGNPTLSVKRLNEKYRELGIEVD